MLCNFLLVFFMIHDVIGFDTNQGIVDSLNSGISHIEGVESSILQNWIQAGRYRATNNGEDIAEVDLVVIAVPTPLTNDRKPDLGFIEAACKTIGENIKKPVLIINESTSFPGTLRNYIKPTVEKYSRSKIEHLYAISPERVDPGRIDWDQKNTPRLVGAIDSESQSRALTFYESICDAVVPVSTPEVAEAAKLLENTFRLVNIALINEFTQLCLASGINVHEVIDAASSKPYGFMPFRPGVGIGGHCIPVDPLYLTWWARKGGQVASLVERSDEIANQMPIYVAERALTLSKASTGAPKVLIMGVAYKPGVGDVRETPASALRAALVARGAEVAWVDPLVPLWEGTGPVTEAWDCDVAIVATNQPGLNVKPLLAKGIPILDCTNNYGELTGIKLL